MLYRVVVGSAPGQTDPRGAGLCAEIATLGIEGASEVQTFDLYFLEGDIDDDAVERLADPVVQRYHWERLDGAWRDDELAPGSWAVEVSLLPGVTDAVAASLLSGARMLGVHGLAWAATGQRYLLRGRLDEGQVHHIARSLLCNEIIQQYRLGPTLPGRTALRRDGPWVESIPLRQAGPDELARISRERLLSLDGAEMAAIQRYFTAIGRDPTDVELETLAQTWSEHCVHKTFRALVDFEEYEGDRLVRQERIDGLLRTFIRAATEKIGAPWVRSAFVDNAGIVDLDEAHEVSFKVETHNHPSALEPFGGANTGVGGVVRDIIGVSARPIANTDVLCFGPTDLPFSALPAGVLHPRRVCSGVVAGIEDYGNKMGIPTVSGAILFHPGYTANPLVYCGCVGIAPKGRHRRQARPGDRAVVIGGRTGRDGLHGATFSSAELTHETGTVAGGAVQIGNPITEKLVLEAVVEARDRHLYSAITDCGAGGLSSAVGEMGREVGATIQLEQVPLKYQGLRPWEIWLSEAQERMVLAVPPQQMEELLEVCRRWDVEATVIGTFRSDRRLVVRFGDQVVADLDMEFLHDGLPRRQLRAVWRREAPAAPAPLPQANAAEMLLRLLADPDIASKEQVIRRYDHEVQGATAVKPLVGRRDDGPADASVLLPLAALWQGEVPAQAGA
ncbi:MAG: AIR synthase-related protein, partial [Anaerolineae bacterium]|nr:AIR synthase-related protein [Anaerolineae bacterium]